MVKYALHKNSSRFKDYLMHFSVQARKTKSQIHSGKISFFLKRRFYLYLRKNGTLTFREIELSCPKLKKLLIFQEGAFRALKKKKTL